MQGIYRIFEPQWKEVILLWLGRENVDKVQKEAFINVLVEFEDECMGYYRHKAYFIAAESITDFEGCNRTKEILEQLFDWAFGSFNVEKQEIHITFNREYPCSYLFEEANFVLRQNYSDITINLLTEKLYSISIFNQALNTSYNQGNIKTVHWKEITDHVIEIRVLLAYSLGKINFNNQIANETLTEEVKRLSERFDASPDEELYLMPYIMQTACMLIEINPGNSTAINIVNKIAAKLLNKTVDLSKDKILSVFPRFNYSLTDFNSHHYIGRTGQINSGKVQQSETDAEKMMVQDHLQIILSKSPFEHLVINYKDIEQNEAMREYIRREIWSGIQVEPSMHIPKRALDTAKRNFVNILTEMVRTNQDKFSLCAVLFILRKIGTGNLDVTAALIHLLHTHQDLDVRLQATYSLKTILAENLLPEVVASLKSYLQDSLCESDVDLYRRCDAILWYCAQNLPYPDFYQAWQQTSIHQRR